MLNALLVLPRRPNERPRLGTRCRQQRGTPCRITIQLCHFIGTPIENTPVYVIYKYWIPWHWRAQRRIETIPPPPFFINSKIQCNPIYTLFLVMTNDGMKSAESYPMRRQSSLLAELEKKRDWIIYSVYIRNQLIGNREVTPYRCFVIHFFFYW